MSRCLYCSPRCNPVVSLFCRNSEPVLENFGVADLIPVPPALGGASIPQISAVVAEEEDEFEEDGVVVLAGPPSPPPLSIFRNINFISLCISVYIYVCFFFELSR